ncbi:helix-turn-helix domain-containing protein [Gloeothece verrucosa]|uniref:HTH cro/C1-type domain-containing protein n=1 Tax=Gloeothece verrucosa (strain PCC 7822) TaxID=497965 RepID=E0U7U7_GLOV7|nr:helix-turn-helix transcriptional regulator [Gloeothece verrucosa]ADN16034.1 hypothetical protein Cyan7822_4114 [Gloeothece verrucosa PCC 7822]
MLDQLLQKLELSYNDFAAYLGIHRTHLWQYRKGKREFRLNWEQVLKLDKLLEKVEMKISDLPPDWYLDPNQREHDENTTDYTNASYSGQARSKR